MRTLRWTIPVATSIALSSATAFATPTITLQPQPTPVVTRVDSNNNPYSCPARNVQTNSCIVDGTSQGIGYHDCIDDTKLSFQLSMTGVPDANYSLQVWAGTGDCTQAGATGNASTGICWQVAPPPQMAVVISPFYVRVADIVRYINLSGTNLPTGFTKSDALTACNAAKQQSGTTTVTDDAGNSTTTAGETTVTIFFLVFPSGASGQAPVANASYPVKVKLVGPNAVSDLAAGSGDGELVVTWTPPSGDTTVQGFDLFAAPSGSSTGLGDAGQTICSDATTELLDDAGNPVLDDAGNPVFVASDAGCTTQPPIVNSCGAVPAFDTTGITCFAASQTEAGAAISANGGVCSQIYGVTTNKGTIQGLQNGTQYDVAVAAFDQFGNSGSISQTVCASPEPINDFWTQYNKDGGNAYCALGFVGTRGGGIAAALMSIIGALFVARRRRDR